MQDAIARQIYVIPCDEEEEACQHDTLLDVANEIADATLVAVLDRDATTASVTTANVNADNANVAAADDNAATNNASTVTKPTPPPIPANNKTEKKARKLKYPDEKCLTFKSQLRQEHGHPLCPISH